MALSLNLSSTLSTLTGSTFGSLNSPTPVLNDAVKEDELSSDNDEPLLSGSGTTRLVMLNKFFWFLKCVLLMKLQARFPRTAVNWNWHRGRKFCICGELSRAIIGPSS